MQPYLCLQTIAWNRIDVVRDACWIFPVKPADMGECTECVAAGEASGDQVVCVFPATGAAVAHLCALVLAPSPSIETHCLLIIVLFTFTLQPIHRQWSTTAAAVRSPSARATSATHTSTTPATRSTRTNAPRTPAARCGSNDRELWEHIKQCLRLKRTKVNGLHWRKAYFFCENCEQLFCGTTAQDDVSCLPPPRSSPALGCELTQCTSASDTRVTGAVPVSRV